MDTDLTKLTVVKLRQELSSRGLDTKGVKAVLIDRLREALEEEHGQENGKTDGKEKESTRDKVASEFNSTITVNKRSTEHNNVIGLIPSSEVVILESSLDSDDFEKGIVQDVLTVPKNKSIVITKEPPVIPIDRLKANTTSKWKSINRPAIKKNKPSETAEVRENFCELSQTRKELIDLQIEQAKEKHAQEMLNLQLQAEASRLKIQYYKSKLDICKDD